MSGHIESGPSDPMRILIVENFRGTSLGQVGVALSEAGAEQVWARPWRGEALPSVSDGFHGMVVLGGEQSAIDDERHPYLPKLARLMKRFGDDDKAVLGICLGSQLLARAHGGTNLLGEAREFGWHRVRLSEIARADPVLGAIDPEFPIFQWHSDTFTLPEGAVHLATNPAAANQCFRVGRASYGMQFHFEANREVVEEWNRIYAEVIERMMPGWLAEFETHAANDGIVADATGLAIARAWVSQVRAA
jgi:GMP synthase-like glutamine amidotransferase